MRGVPVESQWALALHLDETNRLAGGRVHDHAVGRCAEPAALCAEGACRRIERAPKHPQPRRPDVGPAGYGAIRRNAGLFVGRPPAHVGSLGQGRVAEEDVFDDVRPPPLVLETKGLVCRRCGQPPLARGVPVGRVLHEGLGRLSVFLPPETVVGATGGTYVGGTERLSHHLA